MKRFVLLFGAAAMLGDSGLAHADRVSSGCMTHRHEADRAPDLRGFAATVPAYAMP